jgi:hypothetical protein
MPRQCVLEVYFVCFDAFQNRKLNQKNRKIFKKSEKNVAQSSQN